MYKYLAIVCLLVLFSVGTNASEKKIQLNAILNNAAVFTVNGQQLMIKLNQVKNGVKLTELDASSAVVSIAGRSKRIKLGAAIGNYRQNPTTEVRIPKTNGMYLTSGKINNTAVTFLVDTGATVVAFNSVVANQVGIDYRSGQRGIVNTAGGQVEAWRVILNKVDVGGITLFNVEAAIIEGEFPRHVLLGMSFLNQLRMNDDGMILTLEQTY